MVNLANLVDNLLQLPFGFHMLIGISIRLLLILYGCYHDETYNVKYTDIDYKVFTDAARHVLEGNSPYDRHTYRYSPLIAWLLLPNVFFNEAFGKVLFCVADILIAVFIKSYVFYQQHCTWQAARLGTFCSFFWLYNPYSIAISTRGNADSISCLFIILSIYFLQNNQNRLGDTRYFLSGIFLGISIHLRLYPVLFTFPMYLSLGDYLNKFKRTTTFKQGLTILIPTKQQIILTVTTLAYFLACTYGMYLIYGYKFLFETYIYHLFRIDTRHNFSMFFYYLYLRMGDFSFDLIKFTTILCVSIILLLLSLAFGCDPMTLPFALFCQTFVLVSYNSVVTAQYFVWYLSLFPLIAHNITCRLKDALYFSLIWVAPQIIWLLYAYHLEFLSQSFYLLVWLTSVVIFFGCIANLFALLTYYSPNYNTFLVPKSAVAAKEQ